MKDVMSVRLDPQELKRLRELAKRERKEVSAVARELMDFGWSFLMLREYREGKRSLGSLAEGLGVPLSDVVDLLADLGVRSPVEYDDYLRGYSGATVVLKSRRQS